MGEGREASTVRHAVLPLRAIFRRSSLRSEVLLNPTLALALPAVRGRCERVGGASEAQALLEGLCPKDRAV